MTTGELIRRLQVADPEGNTPVCVDNADVYIVERKEAYYDGRLQQLVHDEAKRDKAYSVIGGKIIARGDKVNIVALCLEDVLLENPELPVEIDAADHNKATVEAWRSAGRRFHEQYDKK